jgi:hypothetical protein
MPLYIFLHNLLNALAQIANKMGLQKFFSKGVFPGQPIWRYPGKLLAEAHTHGNARTKVFFLILGKPELYHN